MYEHMFKCTHSSSLLENILAHMVACATSREVWVALNAYLLCNLRLEQRNFIINFHLENVANLLLFISQAHQSHGHIGYY